MSFGFSIGDIIAVSSIALKLCNTLRDAAAEQSAVAHELDFFAHLVALISQRLASASLPQSIARSSEERLSQCQTLLQKLDAITAKYCVGCRRLRTMKWGLWKRDQVVRMLEELRGLIGFLDFLLCSYTTYVTCPSLGTLIHVGC